MKTLSILIGMLVLPSIASAQTEEYPASNCPRPQVDLIAPKFAMSSKGFDSGPVGAYNARVKQYNAQASQFNSCIRSYLDKTTAEGKRIQDEANAEIARVKDAANLRLKSINEKAAFAAKEASEVASQEAAAHPEATERPSPRSMTRRR